MIRSVENDVIASDGSYGSYGSDSSYLSYVSDGRYVCYGSVMSVWESWVRGDLVRVILKTL